MRQGAFCCIRLGALLLETRRSRFPAQQLNKAAAVLAVSESFAALYREAGIEAARAMPNGLSPAFAAGLPPLPPRAGRVRVGHIAGWAYHKGIHLFQAALLQGQFANIEAVVIDHTREESYRLEVMWGSTPTTIRGKVRQEAVIALYGDIDVLVAPSIWPESYGLVSREALQCGVWVVASALGAIGEDIVEGENGFVIDVGTAEGLGVALQAIDDDPGRFKVRPVHRAPARFSSEQTDDLATLYRQLATQPGAGLQAQDEPRPRLAPSPRPSARRAMLEGRP